MPLMPKRTKYRKMQKGRNRGKATRGNVVNEGEYGLQALDAGLITANHCVIFAALFLSGILCLMDEEQFLSVSLIKRHFQ